MTFIKIENCTCQKMLAFIFSYFYFLFNTSFYFVGFLPVFIMHLIN